MQHNNKKFKLLIAVGFMAMMNGCATTGGGAADPNDPWAGWNHGAQSFNDGLDDYVIKPVATGYDWIMPSFAHKAVTNFFSNLDDISVFTNGALQGKYAQSGSDTARFLVNSTAGIGGLIDIGSMIDLPKHKGDFDQTLGKWGVSTGPYLVLPLFGPSSPRGFFGLIGDAALNPISYTGIYFGTSSGVATEVSFGLGALRAIDSRANNLGLEKTISEAALNRYEFIKNAYQQHRKYLVNDGQVQDDDVLKFEKENGNKGIGPISPY